MQFSFLFICTTQHQRCWLFIARLHANTRRARYCCSSSSSVRPSVHHTVSKLPKISPEFFHRFTAQADAEHREVKKIRRRTTAQCGGGSFTAIRLWASVDTRWRAPCWSQAGQHTDVPWRPLEIIALYITRPNGVVEKFREMLTRSFVNRTNGEEYFNQRNEYSPTAVVYRTCYLRISS